MSELGFMRCSCASKESQSSGTPVFVLWNASHVHAKRPLCRHPSCTENLRQSSCEHPEGKTRLTNHSSTMVHLSSTPASSSLCPRNHSGRCRRIRNPASGSQTHRTGSQEEMVHCHLLGKSTK